MKQIRHTRTSAPVRLSFAAGVLTMLLGVSARADLANGQYSGAQVWDVQRSPAFPTAGQPITLSFFNTPFSDVTHRQVTLTAGQYVTFTYVNGSCSDPADLVETLHNSDGSVAAVLSNHGQVYGLADVGFLYTSQGGFGTFVTNNKAHNKGDSVTYTATTGLAACTDLTSYAATTTPLPPPSPTDTTPPTTTAATAPTPNGAGWNNSNVTVTLNAKDDTSVKTITYSATGAQPIGSTTVGGSTTSILIAKEGQTTLSYFATDNANNVETAHTLTLLLDETPPTLALDPKSALPAYTNQASITVTGTATDSGSGVAGAQLNVTGPTSQTVPVSVNPMDGSFSTPVSLSGDGTYTISLQATDVAGNTTSTPVKTLVLDTVKPLLSIVSPANNSAAGTAALSLTYSVTDQDPVTVTIAVSGGSTQTASLLSGSTSPTATASVTLPSAGNNTITVTAVDAAGNSSSAQAQVLLDLLAPVASINIADGTKYGPQPSDLLLFSLTVNDLGATTLTSSSGKTYTLPRGGGVVQDGIPLTEGVDPVTFTITDEVGRTTALTRTVTYDKTPPSGSITAPAAGAFTRGTLNLSTQVTDKLAGVASVSFQIDSGAAIVGTQSMGGKMSNVWTGSVNTTTLADGNHTLQVTMTDGVGNSATIQKTFVVDNTPPTVSVTAPAAGAFVRQTITLVTSASDATSGLAQVTLSVGGNSVGTCTGAAASTCSLSFDTTTLPDGAFTVTATVQDNAGNVSAPAQITATADNSAPKNFLTSPLAGQIVTTSMNVAVNVTDNFFDHVECFVDGVSLGASANPTFSKTVSLLAKLDGASVVNCSAQDKAGNVGTQSVTVNIKNWVEEMRPRHMELESHGEAVRMSVRNIDPRVASVGTDLLPIAGKGLALSLPCVAPVPAIGAVAPGIRDDDDDGDEDNDADDRGRSRVLLKFSRPLFVSSLKAALQAKCIDRHKPVVVTLVVGTHVIGSDTLTINGEDDDERR